MLQIDLSRIWQQLIYNPKEPLLFSSGLFIFLFTGFMYVYFIVHKHHRAKTIFVILFSLYFYYKSSGIYFLLLILSAIVDFSLANAIFRAESTKKKKAILIISLVLNLGMLAYFKYTNFFYSVICDITAQSFSPLSIFLPVGISFFTFQSLSYTIDIYRGTLKPVKSFLDYAFFVTFFPQLVAGPIVRAADFIPQIFRPLMVTDAMIGRGIFLIASGVIKKVVIADFISTNFVDRIFDNPTLYTGLENLFGVYGYALQIYCDFSGYSDMAIGIALLMGFHFKINFDSPYQSKNIAEFWRRWHISLSTWLKDYLYISLGGNRKGRIRTYINLFITMLLGGLWHGAGFRFVLWGAMHGIALAIHKLYREVFPAKTEDRSPVRQFFITVLSAFITFHFVSFCWIFFRAENMETAMGMIRQIVFHFSPRIFFEFITGYKSVLLMMVIGYTLHFIPKSVELKTEKIVTNLPLLLKVSFMILVILLVVQFKSAEIQPFIYFQF
ncbi:MAG TPA: MBOAT family protein [Prolixibacteraceae bacterium]|nr:MBOAT family protein [Prolixibacteraceae bacterium]